MEPADRVESDIVVIRTGDSVLGQQRGCQPARLPGQSAPKCIQMIFQHLSLRFFRHKSSILKRDAPPSRPHFAFPHTPSLAFLCTHFNLVQQLPLWNNRLFFRCVPFLPQHPASFSKVFLFRETIAPRDIVMQAGRHTEQVFLIFFSPPPSPSLSLLLSTKTSEVPPHTSSQRPSLSSGWWRGVGVVSAVCYLCCVCESRAYQIREKYLADISAAVQKM